MLVAGGSDARRFNGGRPRRVGDVEASAPRVATRRPTRRPSRRRAAGEDLGRSDLLRLRLPAAGIGAFLVGHALSLAERVERVTLHLRAVEEDVRAVVRLDKAETSVADELLDRTCGHLSSTCAARRVFFAQTVRPSCRGGP